MLASSGISFNDFISRLGIEIMNAVNQGFDIFLFKNRGHAA